MGRRAEGGTVGARIESVLRVMRITSPSRPRRLLSVGTMVIRWLSTSFDIGEEERGTKKSLVVIFLGRKNTAYLTSESKGLLGSLHGAEKVRPLVRAERDKFAG